MLMDFLRRYWRWNQRTDYAERQSAQRKAKGERFNTDRVAQSKASRSMENDFPPVASAAIAHPVDRVSVCVSRPHESSPDDPLGTRSSAPPSASVTSASIR